MKRLSFSFIILIITIILNYLYFKLQYLVEVGGGYSSKSICSGIFISNRTISSIILNELNGLTILLVKSKVNYNKKEVISTFLGINENLSNLLHFKVSKAHYIGPYFGCQLVIDPFQPIYPNISEYINDNNDDNNINIIDNNNSIHKNEESCLKSFLDYEFTEDALKKNQSRAIIISHKNKIIYENYQNLLNITLNTPLLGWSMTKSILSLIVGVGIKKNLLTLDTPIKLESLDDNTRDLLLKYHQTNKSLTFRHLINMIDILPVHEDYSIFGDVPRFLYSIHNIQDFIYNNSKSYPTNHPKHSEYLKIKTDSPPIQWYYSSAVTNLLSYEFRKLFKNDDEYWKFPIENLYKPLELKSFQIELDPSGTFIGSSFGYGTARDWLKFGELILNKGKYNDKELITSEYIEFITKPVEESSGLYGGQIWLHPQSPNYHYKNNSELLSKFESEINSLHPKKISAKWMIDKLPSDLVYFSGYHGQYVMIIPSKELVIVRLGLTEDSNDIWSKELFFDTIINKCLI